MPKPKEPTKPVGTVAELFAGVGGFRLGLERAGWKTVFSNQWEPSTKSQHASEVYRARFGDEGHSNEDIATVEHLPQDVDLLVGGFPCQDYSVAKSLNSSKGLAGKKGVLWWEILRLVIRHRPRQVFLENVDRLLKSPSTQRGRDFAVMLRTLGDEGYTIEWRVVNAAEYGFPQRRIRVFIVARLNQPVQDPTSYLLSLGILARALPAVQLDKLAEISIDPDAAVVSADFNKGGKSSPFLSSGVYYKGVAYTMKTKALWEGPRQVLGDVLLDDDQIPKEYWIEESRIPEWEYLKGAKSIRRIHADSGVEYNYSEGKMAFPDLEENPARTILTGEGGSTPSRFKHIIRRPRGYRRLTPIELERLNGFEDGWTAVGFDGKPVTDSRRAFFMGNALVVGLIEKVGKVLAEDAEGNRKE
jgi:DNA (cytosine-5)-methyltransferase 1